MMFMIRCRRPTAKCRQCKSSPLESELRPLLCSSRPAGRSRCSRPNPYASFPNRLHELGRLNRIDALMTFKYIHRSRPSNTSCYLKPPNHRIQGAMIVLLRSHSTSSESAVAAEPARQSPAADVVDLDVFPTAASKPSRLTFAPSPSTHTGADRSLSSSAKNRPLPISNC